MFHVMHLPSVLTSKSVELQSSYTNCSHAFFLKVAPVLSFVSQFTFLFDISEAELWSEQCFPWGHLKHVDCSVMNDWSLSCSRSYLSCVCSALGSLQKELL